MGVTKSVAPFFVVSEVNKLVKINGEMFDIAGKNIQECLINAGFDTKRIAVELNGEILPKCQYENTILCNGDCIEVVSFVGGG